MRNWELIKQSNYLGLKVKFSQTCLMKSIGTSWENLTIQLWLKGLNFSQSSQYFEMNFALKIDVQFQQK